MPHPVLGPEDTVINKMGQNHCPFRIDSSVQETENQPMTRKKNASSAHRNVLSESNETEKKKTRQGWAVWLGDNLKNLKDEGGSHTGSGEGKSLGKCPKVELGLVHLRNNEEAEEMEGDR